MNGGPLDEQWLTLRQAARRVRRSHRQIQNWVADGMPTRLQDGPHGKYHEVELESLLATFREKTKANPINNHRTRDTPESA